MTTMTPHLSDGELLLLIDGDDESPSAWSVHLDACSLCAQEARRIRADAALVRDWLQRARFEEAAGPIATKRPGTTQLRSVLRAAAVVILVAAPVAAIPAVREWLQVRLAPGGDGAATVRTLPGPPAAAAAIRFAPDGAGVTVTFAAVQSGGSLYIGRIDGREVVLEIPPDLADAPVVSGDGVRVPNSAASEASYVVWVPASITAVTVRIGPGVIELDAARLRDGVTVALKRP
jgi:hypothetical protein